MDNMDFKMYIETQKINDVFYVYKNTRVSAEETITFYGFCTFMGEKMITCKQGMDFYLIPIEKYNSYMGEETIEDLQKDCCDLIEVFNNPEKFRDPEKYLFVRIYGGVLWVFDYDLKEPETVSFLPESEEIYGITSEEYDIPTSIMLMQERKDIEFVKPLWGFEDVHEKGIDLLEICWKPNKTQWQMFIYKLFSSSYQETLVFIADTVLKLPKILKKKPEIETVLKSVNGMLKFETVKINKEFYACKVEKIFDGFLHEDYFLCTAEELDLLKIGKEVPSRKVHYEIMKKCFKEMYRQHPVSSGYFEDIIDDVFIPLEVVFEQEFNEEDLIIVANGLREPVFEYYEGLSKIPMPRPLIFKIGEAYDLTKIIEDFKERKDIIFDEKKDRILEKNKKESLVFYWIPTKEQWLEISDKYFKDLESTKKYGAVMMNLRDKPEIAEKVIDEYVKLSKKEEIDNA